MRRGGRGGMGMGLVEWVAVLAAISSVSFLLILVRAGQVTMEAAWRGNIEVVGDFIHIVLVVVIVLLFVGLVWQLLTDEL